jgi:hypothetical protein
MNRREFLFTIGTGNGWNCHTLDGFGFRLDPVGGGEAWDWSATRGWGIGVGTGQAESRDAAVDAALESLAEAGLNVEKLPMRD